MDVPRIVVADTGNGGKLAVHLQIKMVEHWFQRINLEIIDNEEYCNDFFAVQQRIDVLIISEDLSHHLQQWHDIGRLFVITDQSDSTGSMSKDAIGLYRFDSLDNLFHIILENSPIIRGDTQKGSQIIVFSSASGGAGKTTVALGVASALAMNIKRVLYIDAERIHKYPSLITRREPEPSSDFYRQLTKQKEYLYQNVKRYFRQQRFDYFPPLSFSVMTHGIPFSTFEKVIVAARDSHEYDYVIVDTDSVYDEYKASLFDCADKVIIISKQKPDELDAVDILMKNINDLNAEKYKLVCNDCVACEDDGILTHNSGIQLRPVERISHIDEIERKTLEDIAQETGIQKTANLVL